MADQVFTGSYYVTSQPTQSGTLTTVVTTSNDYLLKVNNLSDIPNRNTARQNLGITVSVVLPTNPQLNDLWVDLDS